MATTTIENPSSAKWAIAHGPDALHRVELGPGRYMITGQPNVIEADSENEALGKAQTAGIASRFPALPQQGEEVEAGEIYQMPDDTLVMARQTHIRTEHPPADIPALFVVYREQGGDVLQWVVGELIEVGQKREYEGTTYIAIQPHLTVIGQTPDILPAIWEVVPDGSAEWQVGVAYSVGDIVTYEGQEYECIIAHTSISTWIPPVVPNLWRAI